jgi:hypothetical protein
LCDSYGGFHGYSSCLRAGEYLTAQPAHCR